MMESGAMDLQKSINAWKFRFSGGHFSRFFGNKKKGGTDINTVYKKMFKGLSNQIKYGLIKA